MLLCYMFYNPLMLSLLPLEVIRYTIRRLILPQVQMIDITIPQHLSLPLVPLECTFNSHYTSIITPPTQVD
jgi:hypothetical protein